MKKQNKKRSSYQDFKKDLNAQKSSKSKIKVIMDFLKETELSAEDLKTIGQDILKPVLDQLGEEYKSNTNKFERLMQYRSEVLSMLKHIIDSNLSDELAVSMTKTVNDELGRIYEELKTLERNHTIKCVGLIALGGLLGIASLFALGGSSSRPRQSQNNPKQRSNQTRPPKFAA